MTTKRRSRRRLSTEILAWQLLILLGTGLIGAGLAIHAVRVGHHELDSEYIVPSPFNRDVAPAVAKAVAAAAVWGGVARRVPARSVG